MTDLGYSAVWIKLGIVSEIQIKDEIKNFQIDPHPEHWRFRNLERFIKNKIEFSDDEFDMLINIITNDPDKTMISSFCIQMIHKLKLSNYQLNTLNLFFSKNDDDELFYKENFKRKLKDGSLNDSDFLEILNYENMHNFIYENTNKMALYGKGWGRFDTK